MRILNACYNFSVAFLTVLVQRGFFQSACTNTLESNSTHFFEADSLMQITEDADNGPSLEILFAEAVKGSLLSSDSQVQIAALDLIYRYLSSENVSLKECQALIEENIADYAFEILRLSGKHVERTCFYRAILQKVEDDAFMKLTIHI